VQRIDEVDTQPRKGFIQYPQEFSSVQQGLTEASSSLASFTEASSEKEEEPMHKEKSYRQSSDKK